MMITATGQDVYVSDEKFEIGRNFGTKIWNAARFIRLQMGEESGAAYIDRAAALPPVDPAGLTADDKHILARLDEAIAGCDENLQRCRFNDAAQTLYEFLWHQFCDWYVEYAKEALYGDDAQRRRTVLCVLNFALERALRLLHPMMPFLTEELWHAMGYGSEDELIMLAPWPRQAGTRAMTAAGIDAASVGYVSDKHDLIRAGRVLRADYGIPPGKKVEYMVKPNSADTAARLRADAGTIAALLRASNLTIDADLAVRGAMPSEIGTLGTVYMPLKGLVDIDAERERLAGQLAKTEGDLKRVTAKLENQGFVSNAPPPVVEKQRARKQELLQKREKLTRLVAILSEEE